MFGDQTGKKNTVFKGILLHAKFNRFFIILGGSGLGGIRGKTRFLLDLFNPQEIDDAGNG